MIRIPITAQPSQTLAIVLAGQSCQIALRQNGDDLYFDLIVGNTTPVVLTRICRNKQLLLLNSQYRGFVGDFIFNDSLGDTQPEYRGLGTRYNLYYVELSDSFA